MASIIKDIGEIWTRLFDHRPFIQGEITFLLQEFQLKRRERECYNLFKILEYSTLLEQNRLDRVEQLGDQHLPGLKANLDVALSMCECILQKENRFEIENDSKLQQNQKIRKDEWEKFLNDMSKKRSKAHQEFLTEEKNLRKYYHDLEKKLHILS